MSTYVAILNSWAMIEAYLAAEYGYALNEVMRLSWRRLLVLMSRGFTIDQPDDDHHWRKPGDFDWNAALDKAIGRETPSQVVRMTPGELAGRLS